MEDSDACLQLSALVMLQSLGSGKAFDKQRPRPLPAMQKSLLMISNHPELPRVDSCYAPKII